MNEMSKILNKIEGARKDIERKIEKGGQFFSCVVCGEKMSWNEGIGTHL